MMLGMRPPLRLLSRLWDDRCLVTVDRVGLERMAEDDEPETGRVRSKTWFGEELGRLEDQVMGGLDLVVSQLDRALDAITFRNVELARMVAADDRRIDGRYIEVHQGVLSLLGRQPLFADDLRLAGALLHSIRCVERMGDQCANMAKLVQLSGDEASSDFELLDVIENMGIVVRGEVVDGRDAFRARDEQLARDLARQDSEVNRMNRAVFRRALDVGETSDVREWAMFMVLVARCLERISGNAVEIADQSVFVKTGLYREFGDIDDTAPA
jgi:phosphate transport system protein